jgi:hypothetical protein
MLERFDDTVQLFPFTPLCNRAHKPLKDHQEFKSEANRTLTAIKTSTFISLVTLMLISVESLTIKL